MIGQEEIKNRFYSTNDLTYTQKVFIKDMSSYLFEVANRIDNMCPDSRQKSIALTKLQEVKYWVIDCIAKELNENV